MYTLSTNYKATSLILATVLFGTFIQYLPEALALYEHDSLNNVLPTDYTLRTDSALLDLSSAGITYNPDAVRVMIKGYHSIESINDKVHVSHQLKTKDGYIAFGVTTIQNLPLLRSEGLEVMRDVRLEFDQAGDQVRDASRLGKILGSEATANDHDLTGKGVRVAVVDTGTDFSNKDLMHAVARDVNGRPIMLDADGQGIVLTKTKFKANITPRGNLLNSTLPADADEYTGNAYYTDDGIFLNLNRKDNGTKFEVYNSIYPLISPLIINATANRDWKIGENTEDFILSMSGEYRMGFVLQVQFHLGRGGLIIIPVLVVDSQKPGVYDTVIADMSSSWADYNKFELKQKDKDAEFDYSFTDEKRIKLGDKKEFLTYDADKDGTVDLTAGLIGAYVLDIWGAMKEGEKAEVDDYIGVGNATLLKPLDPDGNYFGIMFDYLGHGTGSAASIASSGQDLYDVYKNSTKYKLRGVAPEAKIIPVKALWYGDVVYSWFWVSGFDQDEYGNWKYTGRHKADIVNNSWGISTFPVLDYGPGYDILSLFSSLLSVPGAFDEKFPGVLMVHSAGNTGFGYGTLGSPSSSPFALTVGATTNNVFVGYGFTNEEPRFGNSTEYYDDIAEFSSRGPSILGDVKPEVMSTGAYGFVPMPPNTKHLPNATGPYGLFGGTSMAAPLAAGVAAIVTEALKKEGMEVNPFIVKSILMSTADDMGAEPFTQGSGRVNVTNAAEYVEGKNGKFIVYTKDTYSNFASLLNKALSSYEIKGFGNTTTTTKGNETITIQGNYTLSFPEGDLQDTKWYAGYVNRGESSETTLTVVNRSDKALTVEVEPTMLELIKQQSINGTTDVRKKDPMLNGTTTGFAPNYINLDEEVEIPEDAELMVVKAYFPFGSFLNSTEIYADSLRIASLYFYDWNDKNEDKEVSFDELSMVNRGGSWGTVQEVTVRDPLDRIRYTPLMGVYPVPSIYSYWSGNTQQNSTAMNYTLSIAFYKKGNWDLLSLDTQELHIAPNSQRTFDARVEVAEDTIPGIYQGFITARSKNHTSNIPVSFAVPVTVTTKDVPLVISGTPRDDLLYDNASVSGSFDMLSRYTAGDWRFYHFNITDATVNAVNMKVTWKNNWTSVNAMVTDPEGKIVASSVPAGVFKVFLGWASNDWLGTTRFSQGGGFYPAANYGNNSTVLYVPVNSTGVHTLMLHTTLFAGNELREPITIEAKFTTLLPDTEAPEISIDFPEYVRGVVEIPVTIVDENLGDVTYSINGSELVNVDKNGTITLDTKDMVEGFHHLSLVASDTVGHRVYKDLIFAVDNTDPEVLIRSPAEGDVISGVFDLNTEIFDSTLKGFSVTLPNGTRIDNNKNITVDTRDLADGEYELFVRAEDGAGNVAERTVTFKADNTAPRVSIKSPTEGITVAGMVSLEYDVEDENLDDVILRMGGKSIDIDDSGSYSIDTTTLFDKEYLLEVVAEDMAGNVGSASVNIATENLGPTLASAEEKGIEIGIERGLERGMERGVERGLMMGLVVGLGAGGGAAAVLLVKYRKRSGSEI